MPEIDFNNPNMLLSFYLMASYAYYSLGRPMMSDMEFEEVTKVLHEKYEEVTHPHKNLVPKSALACCTAVGVEYPNIVKCSTMELLKEIGK